MENEKIYFAELNHEYGCETNTNFDFVWLNKKKIIEFNGDKFHGNPSLYTKNSFPNPYFKNLKAESIWNFDKIKNEKALKNNYKILIVWEKDYLEDRNQIIQECKDFLLK